MAVLTEQDFDELFSEFSRASGTSGIMDVYKMMPYLNEQQLKTVTDAKYFIDKWQLHDLNNWLNNIIELKKINRSLGFMPSVKNFLKYSTLDEKVRNVKIQQTNQGE
jgi:hypothetical protein